MGENSGECTQSPSSFKGLKYAKKDRATPLADTDSKDEDDYKNDSGTDDSQLTNKTECTKENTASTYCNILKHKVSIAVVVIAVVMGYFWLQTTQDTEGGYKIFLKDGIEQMREEFPSQLEHIWREFSAGIKATKQGTPTKPSVFMLLYETEERTAICLAQRVGYISTHVLSSKKFNPLIIDGADLEHNETLAEDFGTLLEEYRPKLEEQRAMIIKNLHKIPGTVAQSFHTFCDTASPAVDKAVYLFTMKASGVNNRHNPTEVAEEELRKLWRDELDEDRLNPLITRITDMTMMIRPEKNLAPC